MPSSGQFDSKEQEIDDWLKWDPISSGEGDLLLDDIEKAFSASATVTHAVNHVRLASALNSLPSHALQIKGIIPTPNTSLEPQDSVGTFKELDASSSPFKTELRALPYQRCSNKNDGDAPLTDDATTCRCEINTETVQTFNEFAETSLHLKCKLASL